LDYYTFKDATIKLGAVADAKVREFTLNVNNNAEGLWFPGDNDVNEIIWKGLEVTGNFTLKFEDEVMKDAASDLTKIDIVVTFAGPDDEEIEITIHQARVKWGLENPNDDLVVENIEFTAEYDCSETETIKADVKNKVEEYLTTSP
jgi:hypothetical protein